jgi:hypothetical protein
LATTWRVIITAAFGLAEIRTALFLVLIALLGLACSR